MSESSKLEQEQLDDLMDRNLQEFADVFDCVVDENGKIETAFIDVGIRCAVDVRDLDISACGMGVELPNLCGKCTPLHLKENYNMMLETLRYRVSRVHDGDAVYGSKWVEFSDNGLECWLEDLLAHSETLVDEFNKDMQNLMDIDMEKV